jgi:hypothetical protein
MRSRHPRTTQEKGGCVNKPLFVVCFIFLTFLSACKSPDVRKSLEGKWQAVESQGNKSEKYLSDEIEFFRDGTVTMSDFPDKRLPFKTGLSKEEKGLLKKNYPELEGKNIVLIMLDSAQHDWLGNAVAYQYEVTANELSLRPVISDTATKFRRVTPGR